MLGKIFGKKANKAVAEMKKFENRDLAEALTGACMLVAAADGEIDGDEISNLNAQLEAHPLLAGFGSEINKMVDNYKKQLDAGFLIGKTQIMREIGDCTNDSAEAEDIFVAAITIAQADGEVDEAELKILKEIGQKLNLRLTDYGIE